MRLIDADVLIEVLGQWQRNAEKSRPDDVGLIEFNHGVMGLAQAALAQIPTLTLDDEERQKRSKGCEYCAYECFLQDSEDMEITLYNHTDGAAYDVYPSFCPMCGRRLEGEIE